MTSLRLGGRLHVAVAAFTASQHYNLPQMLVQMFVMLAMLEYIQKKSVHLQPILREESRGHRKTMVCRNETAHVEVDRRPLNPSEHIRLEGTQSVSSSITRSF